MRIRILTLNSLRQATVGDEPITGKGSRLSLDSTPIGSDRKRGKGTLLSSDNGGSAHPPNSSPRSWDSLTGSHSVLLDAEATFYVDNSRPTPKRKSDPGKSLSPAPTNDDDDGWSNWDSPKSPRWSGSTEISEPATPSPSQTCTESHATK